MDPDAQNAMGRRRADAHATEPSADEHAEPTVDGPELCSTPEGGLGGHSTDPEVVGASQDDPWREIMMDLARLIIEVHRDDPHRFDRT